MSRVKTFDATGIAPGGRLYAGDLNGIQDHYADAANFAQTVDLAVLRIGDTAIQFVKFGTGDARLTSALRTDGILRGLGGLFAGAFTTAQRDAIAAGLRPFTLIIFNTTTNRFEWNAGTDAAPNWQPITPPMGADSVSLSMMQDNSVGTAEIIDGSVTATEISPTLKPSGSAAAGTEALRALGTGANNACAGNDQRLTGSAGINTQAASYTLALADAGKTVEMNVASANTLTVPTNAVAPFPIGTQIDVTQLGTGQTTIAASGGVTLRAYNNNLKLAGQYAVISLVKRGTDDWWVAGNLVP